ncbi:conserved hypothetical protein [Parvibaculum lavamentivorans DS-1]|uniref:Glutamine amidotransferase domain-containing protein n=1 Tax=Parvibaculum lavamentivorans (strain DS-1 / DSM 13023 / NCIMB 13966) TaxID=402881 RepID=A7HVB2_PARL1|nr:membrane protein [Parvibaculum lavamentivorans]ABS63845.1 conserved hypothetical protein [Parvibaculum lavamentivorans DS-1]
MAWNIVFEPVIPVFLILALAVPGVVALLYSAYRRARGAPWRTLALAILVAALFNPTIRNETREAVPDVAAIVVDRSQSQNIGARPAETSEALARIEERLANEDGIETRIVTAQNNPDDENGTALFAALEEAFADVPRERIAGAIFITDGQAHDVPANAAALGFDAPVHGVVIGRKDEKDRRLRIVEAPRFGIVGEPVELSFRVDETSAGDQPTGETAAVIVKVDGVETASANIALGEPASLTLALTHGGPNVIEIDVEEGPDELTMLNNRAVVVANGIRDRLRVLLVSGEPHPGERTWRNLLKSDPSVDLVHFTILRPPEKQDGTPIGELSLIAFPTRELFDEKLDQFDLIIFDRYKRRGVLPLAYFLNIVDYVENGGAFLAATGPAFASPYSIYRTPLAAILPAQPTGEIATGSYKPEITETGKRHPVTADLPGSETSPPAWGRWFRTIDVTADQGDVVMDTPDGKPLMVLSHAGEGRVAQLLSDQIWLWSRGYEGGGPQAELLRRLAHWLMKEPDLEEENLSASVQSGMLTVRRRTMANETPPATIAAPSGATRELALEQTAPGRFEASIETKELGLYRISQGELTAVAASGPLNPREFADVRATAKALQPIADASGGGIWWAGENAEDTPGIRSVRAGQDAAGANWMGLRRNEQYLVHAVHQVPLLTGPLALLLILGALALAWWREGR